MRRERRSDGASNGRRGLSPRGLVLLMGALSALGPLSIDMYLPAFPQIAADLGVEVGQVQLTLSFYMVGLSLGQLMYGTLSDRLGRRGPLLFGTFLLCVATAGCALAWSIDSLIACRVAMAFGGSAGMVITRAIVRDLFEAHEAARFFSLNMLVMGAAPILAPIIGGQLLLFSNWRGIFWLITGFSLCCWAALWRRLPESLTPENRVRHGAREIWATYRELLGQRMFMGYTLGSACATGVLFSYLSGAPTFFMEVHGISEQAFGLFFGANSVGLILCSQLNLRLLRRFNARQILLGAYSVKLTAELLLAGQILLGRGGLWTAMPCLWLTLAMSGLVFPNASALGMSLVSRKAAGSASSLMGMIPFALGGLASSAVGAMYDGSARPLALMMALVGTTGWLITRFMTRTQKS